MRTSSTGSIQTKLIIAFLAISLLSVGIMVIYFMLTTTQALERRAGIGLKGAAGVQALAIGELLIRQGDKLTSLSTSKILQEAVAASNITYAYGPDWREDPTLYIDELNALDQKWKAADDSDMLVRNRLNNQPAVELEKYEELFPDHTDVFLTDRIGTLVAATSRPENFYYFQEEWWQSALNEDRGALYIGQPVADEETNTLLVSIAAPVYSPYSDQVEGIIHSTYRLSELTDLLESVEVGHADLILPGGQLFDAETGQLITLDQATLNKIDQLDNETYIDETFDGTASLISQAMVRTTSRDPAVSNLNWKLLVYQNRSEALGQLTNQMMVGVGIALGIFALAALLAIGFARRFSRPIVGLTQVAKRISEGDLEAQAEVESEDEIGILAQTFNTMTGQIREMLQREEQRAVELENSMEEQERLQQEIIDTQQRLIQELSTPVIPVMDQVIVMPLIGSIDSMRARDITRALLTGVSQHQARVVILDITGVSLVDTGVANHLHKTIQAARLKGSYTIVTGISDAVAETIVDLGINWRGVKTVGDMQSGLQAAMEWLEQQKVW